MKRPELDEVLGVGENELVRIGSVAERRPRLDPQLAGQNPGALQAAPAAILQSAARMVHAMVKHYVRNGYSSSHSKVLMCPAAMAPESTVKMPAGNTFFELL